jgi:hypothetical protein
MISRMFGNFLAAAIFIVILGLAGYNMLLPSFALFYVVCVVMFGIAMMWVVFSILSIFRS